MKSHYKNMKPAILQGKNEMRETAVLEQRVQIEEKQKKIMPDCNCTQAAEPYSVWEGKNWMLCKRLIHAWSKELQGRTLEDINRP